uniref:ATP synthase F0 subunit 8 n=1 Tax=Panagrolaimus sp. PS1159 TaxID=55785 RepID=A0AC35GC02_9BILA
MTLTNFQITQILVIFTTLTGTAAVILTIFILCKMWCYSRENKISLIDTGCQCSDVPDSIEFARGIKMSSTLRSDSFARGNLKLSTLQSDSSNA